ncbi:uncharacterized protein LOC128132757 [Lactuca sativa]|uniref:uncharacterized protein LOC128132757 n=1 Tax=Lactuca sativa TaxID=4236 RepID=UPI0022AE9F9C|nr:uncharacterized protein LOC128132757 [Lactuca sativa]
MPGSEDSSSSKSSPSFYPAFGVNNIKNSIPIILDRTDGHYPSWMKLFNIHAYAIVKQWIFATISPDLRQTILKPGASALELWNRLEEIFQDNKATRAVYLEEKFNTTRSDSFSNLTDYSSRLKNLADQLANVGNPISETKMVLQLIAGLTKGDYDIIATLIQQTEPLPSFNKAWS